MMEHFIQRAGNANKAIFMLHKFKLYFSVLQVFFCLY